MRNRYSLSLLFLICLSACYQQPRTETVITKSKAITIQERLDRHFYEYRLQPYIIINNVDRNQTIIELGKNTIEWLDTEGETKIKINNDIISLKNRVTLNAIDDNRKDTVDIANNWDEIKLFKYGDQELIGIRMHFDPCTGLMCSVFFYLIYDVKTKSANFFGTFRMDAELALYDFGNDNKVDYVSKTIEGWGLDTPVNEVYELYSMEDNGKFKELKNSYDSVYSITHITSPDEDSVYIDVLKQNWIRTIK